MRFLLGHSLKGQKGGDLNQNWKGGRVMASNGYVLVTRPDHPEAKKGYVLEHRAMAEAALGRMLPVGAEIHHVDENKSNNTPGNLVLCENRAYHSLLHKRARALAACGNPSAHRCYFCHGYARQSDITITSQGKTRHRSCERAWVAKRRAAKEATV